MPAGATGLLKDFIGGATHAMTLASIGAIGHTLVANDRIRGVPLGEVADEEGEVIIGFDVDECENARNVGPC